MKYQDHEVLKENEVLKEQKEIKAPWV